MTFKAVSLPPLLWKAPARAATTKNTTATMNVKIPYGIAKQGFFNFPVAQPRRATKMPNTPRAMFPFPMPFPASSPGILKLFFYSSETGTLPDYIAPKMSTIKLIKPIKIETPITMNEHLCL
jgi:hypothetical protein